MELTSTEQVMYSVVQLNMLDQNLKLTGTATGFLFGFCGDEDNGSHVLALVTNRHVLSECSHVSITFTKAKSDGSPDTGNTVDFNVPTADFSVYHPDDSVDLAALLVGPSINHLAQSGTELFYKYLTPEIIPSAKDWESFDAVEQVLMVGYPLGLRDTVNNLPIFRRGITATHPRYDFQNSPQLLVDMPCFEGCSGSPVFLYDEGTLLNRETHTVSFGSRLYLLGVQYAIPSASSVGELRLYPVAGSASVPRPVMQTYLSLGFVIKSTELNAIDELIRKRYLSGSSS